MSGEVCNSALRLGNLRCIKVVVILQLGSPLM